MAGTSSVRRTGTLLLVALIATLAIVSPAVRAEDGDGAGDPRVEKLEKEIVALYEKKKYAEGIAKCKAEIALFPKNFNAHYNLACGLARSGKTADALASLGTAVDLGLDDPDLMKNDADLESLRAEKTFEDLVAKADEKGRPKREAWAKLYDPGPEVPDLTNVDGAPQGGLRYRLLVAADATEKKKQRLLVWMHPAGSSMNDVAAPLATQWTKAGFALLLPTQKAWDGWTADEATKLLNVTLADAGKKCPAVDVAKPVLVGYSAGGQMALAAWESNPAPLGGLVLDAAYPIDMAAMQKNQVVPAKLPAGDALKKCPMFVMVGEADGGTSVWKQVQGEWKTAGVPLTIDYVAGKEHEWLLDETRAAALVKWLEDVAKGKLPGAPEPTPPTKTGGGKKK
jgi:predicted esterase